MPLSPRIQQDFWEHRPDLARMLESHLLANEPRVHRKPFINRKGRSQPGRACSLHRLDSFRARRFTRAVHSRKPIDRVGIVLPFLIVRLVVSVAHKFPETGLARSFRGAQDHLAPCILGNGVSNGNCIAFLPSDHGHMVDPAGTEKVLPDALSRRSCLKLQSDESVGMPVQRKVTEGGSYKSLRRVHGVIKVYVLYTEKMCHYGGHGTA